ncbi:DUF6197 family protein [Streptomyces ziwulingensis]|uniref:Uncharacterized protein n=1 Tax=Streptomyces ziwulingensis TaxID=1045501 RepID=A0ABP9D781_9ACTN
MTIQTPIRSPFATEYLTQAALKVTETNASFWVGYSGETITGAETADFLDAARQILEKAGWTRSYVDDDPEMPDLDESMSIKTMLLTLGRYARQALGRPSALTLFSAMLRVDNDDARTIARRVLDALVAAHTGTPTAQATAWAERTTRTWDEVRALLEAGTDFARTHGPR